MTHFFYMTRNIFGLIFVISPLAGFLYIDQPFVLSIVFLSATLIGLPLAVTCYEFFNFKLWTTLCGVIFCYGAFLVLYWSGTPFAAVGSALSGLATGGLMFLLPANIIIHWFRVSKALMLGVIWSISLILGVFWKMALERNTYLSLFMSALFILSGTLFFLEKPPYFMENDFIKKPKSLQRRRRNSSIKITAFSFILSISLGVFSCFISASSGKISVLTGDNLFFLAGLTLGPIVSSLFIEKKGIYSGCILNIFAAEISIMCSGFSEAYKWFPSLAMFSCGFCLSMMTVILPILTYYLYGPAGYSKNLLHVLFPVPMGILLTTPINYFNLIEETSLIGVTIGSLLLLVVGFFTVFSAWKHRLVLLK